MVNDITYLVHSANQSNMGYRKGVMHGSGFMIELQKAMFNSKSSAAPLQTSPAALRR
jgi:hypothetical protein